MKQASDGVATQACRKAVWAHYRKYGRSLPWRKTHDPYRILVSEIMLQQTQVDRVIDYYKRFLRAFPNASRLANASRPEALGLWSGLGYNRRAKFIHEAAKNIVRDHGGKVPRDITALKALPGVGDYTAKAVRVFAYGEDDVLVETNIRTVIIHHFYKDQQGIGDADIAMQLKRLVGPRERKDPRTWNWALMDYGAHLKKEVGNLNQRSKTYTKQKQFKGSLREARGAILRVLQVKGHCTERLLVKETQIESERIARALHALLQDEMVQKQGRLWSL